VVGRPVLAKAIDLEKPKQVVRAENVPTLRINTPVDARVQIPGGQTSVMESLRPAESLALGMTGAPKQAPSRIIAFIRDVDRRRKAIPRYAFKGQTPNEPYLVNCGEGTTSAHDIDRGIVVVQVGFAPLKPAEFVFINLQQLTAGGQS